MSQLSKIIKISRPRFWSYIAGPFLLGYLLGAPNISVIYSWQFFSALLFFLIPANIFLYGVNDLYDEDTDKYNHKKDSIENRLKFSDKSFLKAVLIVSTLIALLLLILTPNFYAKIILILFWLLSYFYSANPLRFKSKPFIDSLSNVLYILPGIYGFILVTNSLPALLPILGFWAWASAMHLFSAIPDIAPDKKANLKTTAVLIGKQNSLIVCTILWLIFFNLTVFVFKQSLLMLLIIYPVIPLLLLIKKNISIEKVYWYFPMLNMAFGFLAFVLIVFEKQ